jgi:alkylation response protein AidB-like acyl-CoA dehydrogenase
MEGFSLGQQVTNKCGMRASSTGELVFQGVKVPTENMLGTIGEQAKNCHRYTENKVMWLGVNGAVVCPSQAVPRCA